MQEIFKKKEHTLKDIPKGKFFLNFQIRYDHCLGNFSIKGDYVL